MTSSFFGPDQPFNTAEQQWTDAFIEDRDLPRSARSRRRRRKIIAAAGAAALVIAGGTGAYVYSALASGGIQPEHVVPADTVAFAKLDLDPAANQKVALYRFLKKFPSDPKGASTLGDARKSALTPVLGDDSALDYATEVEPWLGDRVALAAVPDPSSKSGIDEVAVVAYTDHAKMQDALRKVAKARSDFGYVSTSGYVLMSDSQPHAEAAVAHKTKYGALDTHATYTNDVRAMPGDQVAIGWVDLQATLAAVKAAPGNVFDPSKFPSTAGRVVAGVHATASHLEVNALLRGFTQNSSSNSDPSAPRTLTRLPANTAAAVELTNVGGNLASNWSAIAAYPAAKQQVDMVARGFGIALPGDLRAVFGTDLTASVRLQSGQHGPPQVAVQTATGSPERAVNIIKSVAARFGLPSEAVPTTVTPTATSLEPVRRTTPSWSRAPPHWAATRPSVRPFPTRTTPYRSPT
ncbi:DUF3352 domain-containing protein [Jatrophihabitans sp. DSM 45814]